MTDCHAVRLGAALRRRLGADAVRRVGERIERAMLAGDHVKADLYVAVRVTLCDTGAVFSRSRR